ncbi:MAG: hypothetical protein AAGN46_11055 [Acidobacteriota bacterium]
MRQALVIAVALAAAVALVLTLRPTDSSAASKITSAEKLQMLRPEGADKQPKPEFPGEAAAYEAGLHETPDGFTPAQLNQRAREEVQARRAAAGVSTLPPFSFEEFGPGYYGGRLRGLVVDPNDAQTLVLGSVSGGIWKTTNGGDSWAPINDFLDSLAVGSMIVDPDDDDRIWVGTGEGFFNADAAQGLGVFRSNDFGDSFTQLASTSNSDFHYVNRIGRIPSSDVILVATRAGIFRSDNLGTTWTEVSGISTSGRGFVDLKVDPTDGQNMLAYHYGAGTTTRRMYRSTNGGTSWSPLDSNGLPITDISRMEIAFGQDGVAYAAVSNGATETNGLYRSANGGGAWVKTASNTEFVERQGWYDLPLTVNPFDSDKVYMGAVDMFRTEDAGVTITKQTVWNPGAGEVPQFAHADHHVIEFHPTDEDTFWIGTDGGVYETNDGGDTFRSLNNGLRITQFYGMAVSPDAEQLISGTQDNGSLLYFGDKDVWLEWRGGDGGYCAWDQQQPNFIYGANPGGGFADGDEILFGSTNGGSSVTFFLLPDSTNAPFIVPFELDPNDGNRMMLGTDNVFYSTDVRLIQGAPWADVSGGLVGAVASLAFHPLDPQQAFAGTTAGAIYKTTGLELGSPFVRIDGDIPLNSDATSITVDENDASGDTIFATFADYGADRVWKSTDGGTSWASISGDLPGIPTFDLVVDPLEPNRLWLGTELGLFTTEDHTVGSPTWLQYDYGTAWTRVSRLWWSDDDTLWIGTHGRGMYRGDRNGVRVELLGIEEIQAVCDGDGVLDNGESAIVRLELQNATSSTLTGITARLQETLPGLQVTSGILDLADLAPGATVTVEHVVSLLGASCLDEITLTSRVDTDAGTFREPITVPVAFTPVEATGTLSEDAEDATTAFLTEARIGADDWTRTSTSANTGTFSWFAADIDSYVDKSLISPWIDAQAGGNVLTFALRYDMEGDATQLWDGTVLELQVEGDEQWIDIGELSTVPYDGPLFVNNTAPARNAWSGTQLTWRDAEVDLGTTYEGQRVRFRFRVICDTLASNPGGGVWLDDIEFTNATWVTDLACDTAVCDGLFADDFEVGNATRWSNANP